MVPRAIFVSGNKEVRQYNVAIDWTEDMEFNRDMVTDISKSLFKVPLLEVSRASDITIGVKLAPKLLVMTAYLGDDPARRVEEVYQSSKKCVDGRLTFNLNGVQYPLEPKSVFYDWIYCIALVNNMLRKKYINKEEFLQYRMFTDIFFNPTKKVACQARSCALFSLLLRTNRVKEAMKDFESFKKVHQEIVSYETYSK